MKQEMTGWQSHQLDHMQIICASLQLACQYSVFYRPDALLDCLTNSGKTMKSET